MGSQSTITVSWLPWIITIAIDGLQTGTLDHCPSSGQGLIGPIGNTVPAQRDRIPDLPDLHKSLTQ